MTAAPVFSFAGLLLLLFGGAFSGLPLGIPPGEFDPVMARVAPQECLFYVGWSGTAEPSAKSANRTEQLLADPEVQRLWTKLVYEPVYNAVNRYQPILKKHKMMDQVFRFQDLDALVDGLEAQPEDGHAQPKHKKTAHPRG